VWNHANPSLTVELPDNIRLEVDGVDKQRGADELIMYRPSYGHVTGANEWGVEVVVRKGAVTAVRPKKGYMPIPEDGYVLSAHVGTGARKAKVLAALEPGASVRLLSAAGTELRLDAKRTAATAVVPLSGKATRLFILHAARGVARRGTQIGRYLVMRRDGSAEAIPLRYGVNVSAATGMQVSSERTGPQWAAFSETVHQTVRGAYAVEWVNTQPETELAQLRIELNSEGSMTQLCLLAVTLYE